VSHTAGRLPLELALALGVGLFESLLVTCGRNQAERRIGQVWLDCALLGSPGALVGFGRRGSEVAHGNEERSWNVLWCCFGATSVSNLDPTYHTLPKTKHTCELLAVVQVQADEWHALECLDVAWGNGVGGGRVRRNEAGSWKGSQ